MRIMTQISECALCGGKIEHEGRGRAPENCKPCQALVNQPDSELSCVICHRPIERPQGHRGRPIKYCDYCREPGFRLYNAAKQHWHRADKKKAVAAGE